MGKASVTFLNGHSPRKNSLGLLAFPDALRGDFNFCRFFSKTPDDKWFHTDFDFQGKSVTAVISDKVNYRAWWILGKNGEVVEIVIGGTTTVTQIPGAGLNWIDRYGYVETIKNIDNELYVCGYGRQVYKRVAGQWVSVADEILTHETAKGFFDIDGTDSAHIYAVGWKGEIYFYDDKVWYKDDSPTTAHLASVRCLKPDDVWICGDKGIVLHGSFNQWTVIKDDAFTGNWYGIEEYEGNIYLAGNGILAYIDGDSIKPVDVGLGRSITTYRLHSKDGLLWSIGEKDILVFDGSSWNEILHPDNI